MVLAKVDYLKYKIFLFIKNMFFSVKDSLFMKVTVVRDFL